MAKRNCCCPFYLSLEVVPVFSKILNSIHAIMPCHVASMLIKFHRILITFWPLFTVTSFSFLGTVGTQFIFLKFLWLLALSSYTLLLVEIVFLYIFSNLLDSSFRMKPKGIIPLGDFSRTVKCLYQVFSEGPSRSCCPTWKVLWGQRPYAFNKYVLCIPTIYLALCQGLHT